MIGIWKVVNGHQCAIHTAFSSNDAWPHDWSYFEGVQTLDNLQMRLIVLHDCLCGMIQLELMMVALG